jgi:hypothetical protein
LWLSGWAEAYSFRGLGALMAGRWGQRLCIKWGAEAGGMLACGAPATWAPRSREGGGFCGGCWLASPPLSCQEKLLPPHASLPICARMRRKVTCYT